MRATVLFAIALIGFAASAADAGETIAKAKFTYAPWQAAWDAHARSEAARLQAIDRQRQRVDLLTWYGTIPSGVATPIVPYGRGQLRYERRLSRSPYQLPFPAAPGTAYPHGGKVVPVLPYLTQSPPPVEHPIGHTKTWTSENSYVYQPIYASDPAPAEESVLAPMPGPVPSETVPTPAPMPEAIPTPQPE